MCLPIMVQIAAPSSHGPVQGLPGSPDSLLCLCRDGALSMDWPAFNSGTRGHCYLWCPSDVLLSPTVGRDWDKQAQCFVVAWNIWALVAASTEESEEPHTCSLLCRWQAVRTIEWRTMEWIKAPPVHLLVVIESAVPLWSRGAFFSPSCNLPVSSRKDRIASSLADSQVVS